MDPWGPDHHTSADARLKAPHTGWSDMVGVVAQDCDTSRREKIRWQEIKLFQISPSVIKQLFIRLPFGHFSINNRIMQIQGVFILIGFYCWKHRQRLLKKDPWCCFSFPPAGYLHRWSLFIPSHTDDDWQLLQTRKCKTSLHHKKGKKFVLLFFLLLTCAGWGRGG